MKKILEFYQNITQPLFFKRREKRPSIEYIMREAPLEERLYWFRKVSEIANKEQQDNMKRWEKIKEKTIQIFLNLIKKQYVKDAYCKYR